MKNFKYKNNIAFTLAEMTIVLLIVSIIAAVSAPIVTNNIKENAKSYSFVKTSPWTFQSNNFIKYDISGTKMISIGFRPGAAYSTYGKPTLAIASNSSDNLAFAPQIAVGTTNSKVSVISSDQYRNILIGYANFMGNFANSSNRAKVPGSDGIFIGSCLFPSTFTTEGIFDKAIAIGQYIDANPNQKHYDTITIGYAARALGKDSISIGSFASYVDANKDGNKFGMINIGSYAGAYTYGSYRTINIGNHAGKRAFAVDSINIGTFAGAINTSNATVASGKAYQTLRNIAIGSYAAYQSVLNSDNIMIGDYAGIGNAVYNNAIMIGAFSGTKTTSLLNKTNSDIAIGFRAGNTRAVDTAANRQIIAIGQYSLYNANSRDHIAIGAYTGSNNLTGTVNTNFVPPGIAIGAYAGAFSKYSNYRQMAIGYYAATGYNPDIAIGSYAGQAWGGVYIGYGASGPKTVYSPNRVVIGSGSNTGRVKLTDKYGVIIYGPSTTGNVVFISPYIGNNSFVSTFYNNSSIILYAATVASLSSNMTQYYFSDKRLKENITLSSYSIGDLRKINVYNYSLKMDESHAPKIGVIAQEVKKVFPQAVSKMPVIKRYAVNADWILYTMVNAVKELDKNIECLKSDFKAYVKDFMGLKSRVANLEIRTKQLRQENKELKAHLKKINEKLN